MASSYVGDEVAVFYVDGEGGSDSIVIPMQKRLVLLGKLSTMLLLGLPQGM